ncbi:MAG: class I SAM-dependent methyltransferase [Acidobacteria bacterium]|nr:class I SAM-dependent methyltransferase [Acidobacteriota bacterium]
MRNRETTEWVAREACERLYPHITNPNWLILTARRKLFATWVTRVEGNTLRVLDVGGRIQPYRPLLNGRIRDYYSLDLVAGPLVSAVGKAEALPFPDNHFDLVFCTQMLEYVPVPQEAIDEIHRVLRPSGCLFLSAPAVFPRDSDPEYWRFLPSSLQLLLRNFSNVEIAAEGSTISGLVRTLNVSLITFSPRLLRSILRYTATPALNGLALVLERLARTTNNQFTANFSAFARK